jgi:hypothetical protein
LLLRRKKASNIKSIENFVTQQYYYYCVISFGCRFGDSLS